MDSLFDRPSSLKRQFTCFCASDARKVPADVLAKFCSRLIKMGCAYLCSWGPACERVHDAMDEELMADQPPDTYIGCLMTTRHAKDSLDNALWYLLNCTEPTRNMR
jgi:hypothetical protein